MKLVLDQPSLRPFDPTTDMRVLIACEDAAAAEQACALLDCVGRNCEPDGRLIYRWWNFEMLAVTVLRELASDEAAVADMIIIAAHEGRKLPGEVTRWMAQWLDLRKGRRGALVALLDSNSSTPDNTSEILSQLKESAALGLLDFFVHTRHQQQEDDPPVGEAAWQFVNASIAQRANQTDGRRGSDVPHLGQDSRADHGYDN